MLGPMGTATGEGSEALLLIDVIGRFDFPEAEQLLPKAARAAERLAALKAQARSAGAPVLYVNDNYGHWDSDFKDTLAAALASAGRPVAEQLEPEPGDYFVLKPKNSGFHATPLEVLLSHLGVKRLVVGGFATELCVLYTVHDAHARNYRVRVLSDGVAAAADDDHRFALAQMARLGNVELMGSRDVTF